MLLLHERPEEQLDEFFKDNIYTCEKFKFDLSKLQLFSFLLSVYSSSTNDASSETWGQHQDQ